MKATRIYKFLMDALAATMDDSHSAEALTALVIIDRE
jgi:hypothetical protein